MKAAVYVRVSSAQQEENGTSLETQEAACRQLALELGATELEVYREVHTGVELWERPELTRLRQDIRGRQADLVLAYAIDRLARDPVHLGVVLSEAEHHGVPVHFVTEPLDNTPEGQLIRFVKGYAAKVEHEKIKERTVRGRMARVAKGMPLVGAFPPYGYGWADERKSGLAVRDDTARHAQGTFRSVLEGATIRSAARQLDLAGAPTPTGRAAQWSASTVRAILTSTTYIGEHRVGGAVLPCPALVDRDAWQRVQERLQENKDHGRRNNSDPEATLLRCGFCVCGTCGYRLSAQHNRVYQNWQYVCPNRGARGATCPARAVIDAAKLDELVWGRAVEILTKPEIVKDALERELGCDPTADDLAGVDRSLAQVSRKQASAARAASQLDEGAEAPVLALLRDLASQRAQLDHERQRILAQRAQWEAALRTLEDVYAWCSTLAETLPELDYERKRRFLRVLGTKVTVWPAAHTPRLEIQMGPPVVGFVNNPTPGGDHNLLLRMVI